MIKGESVLAAAMRSVGILLICCHTALCQVVTSGLQKHLNKRLLYPEGTKDRVDASLPEQHHLNRTDREMARESS